MNTAKLKAAAEKATPGRVGDRIDGSGSIKYRCVGADGSLVLLTDHKNNEYGFVGDNGEADELFFRLCTPEAVLELIAALEAAEKRIAELEARKLRVKMPALRNAEIMSDLAWNSAIDHCFDALIKATDDAGINLETRGEA
ncbi:ead/Ea22-like family protein [Cronobacter sakazakii]|uniref:ead/Ea22-like family protein n=1 Tax=Cronobacter sakazakii TaxID=28141 RepID=UPI000CFAEB95|nr:ead/Ea22-like family protein [Cronobacter sakazakii]PQY37450.1 hypothetical protein C5947_16295 [Cronobacter sakazakii]